MSWKHIIIILLVLASLAACNLPATPTGIVLEQRSAAPTALATASGQAEPAEIGKEPVAAPQPLALPQPLQAGSRETLRDMALADLADRLKLPSTEIVVQNISTQQFSDTSLGLAKPGQMYAQVITPGYVIQLQAGDKLYRYHATGSRVVFAGQDTDQSQQRPLASPPAQTADSADARLTLYYSLPAKAGADCTLVFPVERELPAESPDAELALGQLFAGPTEPEVAAGYTSPFSPATQDALISLQIKDDTAYVDLRDIRELVELPDACARRQFQQQILRTVQAYAPVQRLILALEGDPQAIYTWLKLPCDSSNDNCDAAPFSPTRIPLQEAQPTVPPVPATVLDLEAAMPDDAAIVRQTSLDMDGDRVDEVVAVVGMREKSQGMDYDWLKLLVVQTGREPKVLWQMRTLGTRAEAFDLRDINGDGQLEALSVQSMGASGQTLYVVAWRNGTYGLLRPQGGYFAGWDSFGDQGVGFEDVDSDGIQEILAAYGPAASKLDVYHWDGRDYVYQSTRDYSGTK